MGEKIHVMSAVFGSEYRGFITGADQVIRKSGEVGRAVGRALGAVDNMLTRLAVGAVTAATVVGGATAKMGGDFLVLEENAMTSFETLLGSAEAARKMWLDLKQIARESPFEMEGITDAARKLLGMGYAGKDIPRVLRAIGDAIAAMGGGQEMINRVSIALGQIKAKGVVAAEEMLQLAENGIPAWQMLADAIGVDIPTAMKLVEDRAVTSEVAIAAILGGIEKRFGGMSLKMANNWTGLWAAFIDTAKEKSGDVMKPLFLGAKKWLQQTTDYLLSAGFKTFVSEVAGRIQGLVDEVNGLLRDMGGGSAAKQAQSMLLSLLDVIRDAIGWIRDNRGAIAGWGSALGSWLKPIGQIIAAHPELVMFFALFKTAQLFGITTAIYEVGRAMGVTAKAAYTLAQPAEAAAQAVKKVADASTQLSATQKFLQATNAAVVTGVNQTSQAINTTASTTAALTVESVKAAQAQANLSGQARFFAASSSLATQATTAAATATGSSVLEMHKATQARQSMTNAERFFADSSRATASAITQAALPAQQSWASAIQGSSTVTVSAARANEALADSATKANTPLSTLANTAKGQASSGLNTLKNAASQAGSGIAQLAAQWQMALVVFGTSIGFALLDEFIPKAKDVNEQLRETLKLMDEARAKQLIKLDGKFTAPANETNEQKVARLEAQLKAENEEFERLRRQEAAARRTREEAEKETDGVGNTTLRTLAMGMGGTRDSVLSPFVKAEEESRRQANSQSERMSQIEAELNAARASGSGQQVPGGSTPPGGIPPFDPNQKKNAKAAAKDAKERESDIEQAKRSFRRDMANIFQDGVPQEAIDTFQQQFDKLVEAYRQGTSSTEEFEKSLEALAATSDRTAQAGKDVRDMEEDLRKAVEQGLPQAWADRFVNEMKNLAVQFQNGEITADQYQRAQSGIQQSTQTGVRMADQNRDFAVKAKEFQADGQLSRTESDSFIDQMQVLQTQLNAGAMTMFEYETALKSLGLAMQNQAQANVKAAQLEKQKAEALRNAGDNVAKALDDLAQKGFWPTERQTQELKTKMEGLRNRLNDGKISVSEFNDEVAWLTRGMERAAEQAQRAALMRGDWANAGNDFNIQRAIEERLLDIRRQQFGNAIDGIVQRMTGFGGAVQGITDGINRAGQTLKAGINSTVTYVGEQLGSPIMWDRIQLLTQQIGILTNSMNQAPTYSVQKRLADQIEDLNRQLSEAYQQSAPTFFSPQGNSRFEDPGANTAITVTLPNITKVSQQDLYQLTDAITREQKRRGNFRSV